MDCCQGAREDHRVELAYANRHVYARCIYRWEGTHRPDPGGQFGSREAYQMAEGDAVAHEEEVAGGAR